MSNTWIIILIIAVVSTVSYTGWEFYNSFQGNNVEFNKQVVPISNELNEEVLQHIEESEGGLYYEGDSSLQ